ncbi:hypothetical protein Tco_0806073, partial [Tanacetum coccineum]
FGRHLEEIHVTWTQFGKKRDKIATLYEDDEELIVRDVPKAAVLAYCYVLLDREANVIQLNTDADDIRCFNTIGKIGFKIPHPACQPRIQRPVLTEEGTFMFEKNDERITFKLPHKMERFEDIEYLTTDNIPPFFVTSKGDEEKGEGYVIRKRMTRYLDCLKLRPDYKRDEGVIETIQFHNGRSSVTGEGVT